LGYILSSIESKYIQEHVISALQILQESYEYHLKSHEATLFAHLLNEMERRLFFHQDVYRIYDFQLSKFNKTNIFQQFDKFEWLDDWNRTHRYCGISIGISRIPINGRVLVCGN